MFSVIAIDLSSLDLIAIQAVAMSDFLDLFPAGWFGPANRVSSNMEASHPTAFMEDNNEQLLPTVFVPVDCFLNILGEVRHILSKKISIYV